MVSVLLCIVCLFGTSLCTSAKLGHAGVNQKIRFLNGDGAPKAHVHAESEEEILNGLPASEMWETELGEAVLGEAEADLRWAAPMDAVNSVGQPLSMTNQPVGTQLEEDDEDEADHSKWAIPVAACLALVLPAILFVTVFCYFVFTFDFTSEERDENGLPCHRHYSRRSVSPPRPIQKTASEIQCGVIIVCNTAGPDGHGDHPH